MKYPCSIKDFLRSRVTPDFAGLITIAAEIKHLEDLLKQRIEPELAAQLRLGGVQAGELTLYADSPAWANRLRFHSDEILIYINKIDRFSAIRAIRIQVMPKHREPTQAPRVEATIQMAPTCAHLLEGIAEGETDPSLKTALENLARKGRV